MRAKSTTVTAGPSDTERRGARPFLARSNVLQARCLLVESRGRLVTVAQLAEHRVVVPKVAGSSPVGHPGEVAAKYEKTEPPGTKPRAF